MMPSQTRRRYKPLPFDSIEHATEYLKLSENYPSGLEWVYEDGWRTKGEMCGKWNATGEYYVVRLFGEQYHAHRIVYFLRTGEDPAGKDIIHGETNKSKDNRKDLMAWEGFRVNNVSNRGALRFRTIKEKKSA
jgi:hypothetical protein